MLSDRASRVRIGGARNASFPGISRRRAATLRQRGGARVRPDPRLPRRALDVRAAHVRARARRGRPRRRGVHTRLLPSRSGPLPGGHGDEAVARHPQEPQAPPAAPALPGGADQAVLRTRLCADRGPLRAPQGLLIRLDSRIGEVYLDATEIRARVAELAAEIARDYRDREPLLIGTLKACIPFVVDLSRSLPIHHALDFV